MLWRLEHASTEVGAGTSQAISVTDLQSPDPQRLHNASGLPSLALIEHQLQRRQRQRPSIQNALLKRLPILPRRKRHVKLQRHPRQHALHLPHGQLLADAMIHAHLEREEGRALLDHPRLGAARHPPLRNELQRPLEVALVALDQPLRLQHHRVAGDVEVALFALARRHVQAFGRRDARVARGNGRHEAEGLGDDGFEEGDAVEGLVGEGGGAGGEEGVELGLEGAEDVRVDGEVVEDVDHGCGGGITGCR